jgi:hypothetical protein
MEALDLSIDIKSQKKIENFDQLDPKVRKARKEAAEVRG